MIWKLLYKLYCSNTDIDRITIVRGILERRQYVESAYKGGDLFTKGFVFVLINQGKIFIGHDLKENSSNVMSLSGITSLIIALNYFERI